MDIYDYLKMDHKNVDKLFELFKSAGTYRNKTEIFEMIDQALTVHAQAEEQTFYQFLVNRLPQLIEHSEEEHALIKMKLAEMQQIKNIVTMEDKMRTLEKIVKHHVAEEEDKIFPAAKAIISEKEAVELKEKMHDLKGKLLLAQKNKENAEMVF